MASNGSADANGQTWSTAMTLPQALANASCTTIWLKQGVYRPVVPANKAAPTDAERQTSFVISRPIKLYGGFTGQEQALDQRPGPVNSELTVLSGDIGEDDIAPGGITRNAMGIAEGYSLEGACSSDCNVVYYYVQSQGDQRGSNSNHVVFIRASNAFNPSPDNTLLDGLTITAGNASIGATRPPQSGGGLHCQANQNACSPHINNVSFVGNYGHFGGSALHFDAMDGGQASPLIENSYFSGNLAYTGSTVDIYVYRGTAGAVVRNSTFYFNAGAQTGAISGAASGGNGTVLIEYSTFLNNQGGMASAIDFNGSGQNVQARISHSVIWGGYTYSGSSRPVKDKGYFVYRAGSAGGGGMFPDGGTATLKIDNSLVYECIDHAPTGISCDSSTVLSGIDPLLDQVTPAFNDGGSRTLAPPTASPLLDATTCLSSTVTDQRGLTRPQGAQCDMGAVEVAAHSMAIRITGQGTVSAANDSAQPLGAQPKSCNSTDCTWGFPANSAVSLVATPADQWALLEARNCAAATMTADLSCAVTFYNALVLETMPEQTGLTGEFKQIAAPRLSVAQAPLAWSMTGAPPGMAIDADSGILSGSPTQIGDYDVILTATDSQNITGTVQFNIRIAAGTPALTLAAQTTPNHVFAPSLSIPIAPQAVSGSTDNPAGAIHYASSTPDVCTITDSNIEVHMAGNCLVYATQDASANYQATRSAAVQVAIAPATPELSFAQPLPASQLFVPNATFPIAPVAVSSMPGANRPIIYNSKSPDTCAVDGTNITMLQPGVCLISANQPGDASHKAAAEVTQSVQIEPQLSFTGTTVPRYGAGGTAVASFTGGGATCTFDTTATGFEAAPRQTPANMALPQGMFAFKLVHCAIGATVRMHITWPQAIEGYQKQGKASADAMDLSFFEPSNMTIDGLTVSFDVTDGDLGDDDWTANGILIDPTGPSTAVAIEPVPVPTLNTLTALLLAISIGGLGLYWRARNQSTQERKHV